MMLLDRKMRSQIVVREVAIAAKRNVINPVFSTFLNFVQEGNLVRLFLKNCFDLNVKIAFLLEIIDKVALAFIDQIAVNGAFLIDRNQLLFAPSGDERNYRKPGAIHAHHNHRPGLYVESDIRKLIRFVELRVRLNRGPEISVILKEL